MVSPIYFNVKEAREFLLATGFVYTLRKPRSVGKTVALQGSYFNHVKLCDVRVFLVKEDVTLKDLYRYVERSGFDSVTSWFEIAKTQSGIQLNLYRVKRVIELPYCPVHPNYAVRKDGLCTRFLACAATGGWRKHPYSPALVFYPDLTKHLLCKAHGQTGVDAPVRQEEKEMTSKSKKVKSETAALPPAEPAVESVAKSEAPAKVKMKDAVTEENVLAIMAPEQTYSSTDLLRKLNLGLNYRHTLNQVMTKLVEAKKVALTVKGEEGKRKRFVYKLA